MSQQAGKVGKRRRGPQAVVQPIFLHQFSSRSLVVSSRRFTGTCMGLEQGDAQKGPFATTRAHGDIDAGDFQEELLPG